MESPIRRILGNRALESAGVTINELAKITGISNTYFNYIRSGKIKKPGRDKLITIGGGLNYSLAEIDGLLQDNNYMRVMEKDVDIIITAAKRRQITGFQPLYENINYPVLLLSLDNLPGKKIVVNKKPSSTLESPEYLLFRDTLRSREKENPMYHQLKRAILLERKKLLDRTLAKYEVHHLVCFDCFNTYVKRSQNSHKEKQFIIEHLQGLLKYLEHPRYRFNLIDQCPRLRFVMKVLPNRIHDKNKMIFTGYGEHRHVFDRHNMIDFRDRLFGIATDSPKFFDRFMAEFEELKRNFIRPDSASPQKVKDYINKIIKGLR